ncbi:chaperone protein dnaJ 49 [Artemisia annua]|uniref:Chaperone protein dnaJ 49 n=1 Tax=Artemisia annua TaxID=35608 RepID=A0A2U1M2B5_ARTAN|nr:chaperone protein dnaJ 49 [Artemisia annua]
MVNPIFDDFKEINNAYKRLAKKVHPNNNKAPGSDEAFRKVQEAYECLSHTGKYLRYKFLYRLTPGAPTLYNTHNYKSLMMTKEHGINFYVESLAGFNEKYPVGTSARADIEYKVINDYIKMVQEYCNDELRWHSQRPEFPTPACDKLQPFRTHI